MAAGLGFKTFVTGEVLTAGDVNGYLMQGVLVFATEAARNSAITSPQEGQFAYTKDTNSLWYYTGSAWAASGATGDIEGVTAGTGLTGGGTSGTVTLAFDVANYGGGSYAAGKNKIINGDFSVNQRNFTTVTTPANGTYTFDRYETEYGSVTPTYSAQAFTAGAAPVAGYEGTNFLRIVTASAGASSYCLIGNRIEDVRSFAGQTITVSLWAKAATGTPKISIRTNQSFGSGGSGNVAVNATTAATISTSWVRYSFTINIGSVSGKTIGANSYLQISVLVDDDLVGSGVGIQNNTFDIWGLQAEEGSTATDFQTASGSIAGELALCQRYYVRFNATNTYSAYGQGIARSSQQFDPLLYLPVTMRVGPTSVDFNLVASIPNYQGSATSITAATINQVTPNQVMLVATSSGTGLTQNSSYYFTANNSTSSYVGFGAEL